MKPFMGYKAKHFDLEQAPLVDLKTAIPCRHSIPFGQCPLCLEENAAEELVEFDLSDADMGLPDEEIPT